MPEDPPESAAKATSQDRLAVLEAEDARLRRELDAARRDAADAARFRAVLASATDYAILTLDPDLRVTGWNAGAEHLLGWREAEALGMDGRLTFTPEDRARGDPEAEAALAAAEGRAGNERWHARKGGGRFWGSGLLVPLRGGPEPGFLKIMRDCTERREADERQRALLDELAHRVKNMLAVVLAMARQAGGGGGEGGEDADAAGADAVAAGVAGFLADFEGRLLALAAVHDLLSGNGWLGTPAAEVARAVLAPHTGDGRVRLAVDGAAAPLKPAAAQSLTLALHELATNAAKHGALSAPGGSVTLEGRVEGEELVLAWRETGGPPVSGPPRRRGFGSEMLERGLAYQHGARAEFEWRPEGLACTLRLPLAEVAASVVSSSGGGG